LDLVKIRDPDLTDFDIPIERGSRKKIL